MSTGFFHENEIDPLQVEAEDAQSFANLAKDWAIKMDGPVKGASYSSQWNAALSAQSADTATQAATDAAEQVSLAAEWSSQSVDTLVTGTSEYSAYHWAVKAADSAATSLQAVSDAQQQVTTVTDAATGYISDITVLGDQYLADIAAAASPNAPLATDGSSFTLALVHGAKYLRLGATAAAETITVPANSAVAFAVGVDIHIANRDSESATLAAAAGVTINLPYLGGLNIPPGGTVSLKKVGTDEWDLYGVTEA